MRKIAARIVTIILFVLVTVVVYIPILFITISIVLLLNICVGILRCLAIYARLFGGVNEFDKYFDSWANNLEKAHRKQ